MKFRMGRRFRWQRIGIDHNIGTVMGRRLWGQHAGVDQTHSVGWFYVIGPLFRIGVLWARPAFVAGTLHDKGDDR